jgi:hypothetical protein
VDHLAAALTYAK